jgi:hypothetical protein
MPHSFILAVASGQQPLPSVSELEIEFFSRCAPIVSAAIAFAAACFVSYQIVLVRRAHQTNTFLKIMEMAREEHFKEASNWVKYTLNDTSSYQTLKPHAKNWDAISQVVHFFEALGILVNNNFISRALVFDQMGTWIAGSWIKLQPIIMAHRVERRSPEYAENFEILAEKYEKWAKAHPAKKERRPRHGTGHAPYYYGSDPKNPI